MITLDFETYYDRNYSLSKLTTEAYIRDPRFEIIGVAVQQDDEPPQWYSGVKDEIGHYLHQYEMEKEYVLAHNMAFDGAILAWHFGIKPKYYLDTLSMARPVTGQTVGGSLAALSKQFLLGEKGTEVVNALGKRRMDFSHEELTRYAAYCKNDVELTYTLFQVLRQFVTSKELYLIDVLLRMYTDPVLELDRELLADHLSTVKAKKQLLLDRVGELSGKDDLMSNQKFAAVLKQLGVIPPMKVSPAAAKRGENTMTYAFGKNDLEFKALLDHQDPRVQTLVAARLGVKSTLEETRTASFIDIAARGPLPIMLNYWGAHTGRASGGDNMNLQNLPRGGKLRQAMKAPAGHKLLASDSSQIEARMTAWLAGQDSLVDDFRQGKDIYSLFATDVFGREITKADKTERFVGKTCILGLGYGTGAEKLKATLKIGQPGVTVDMSLEEATRVVKLYREKYFMIPTLWKSANEALAAMSSGGSHDFGVGIQLKCDGQGVHLPNGMLIRYPELQATEDGYQYRSRKGPTKIYGAKLVENVVQALARIVVFDQMGYIDKKLRPLDTEEERYRVVLTVHDEIVVCAPAYAISSLHELVKKAMSTPPTWASGLPIACEVEVGDTYGDCK